MVEETSDAILAKKLFQNVASTLFSLRYYSTYRYKSWKRVITPLYGVPKNLGQFSRLFFAALLPPPHYRSMSHLKAAEFSLPIFSVRILMLKYAMLSLMLLIIIYTNHILFMHYFICNCQSIPSTFWNLFCFCTNLWKCTSIKVKFMWHCGTIARKDEDWRV